MNTEQAILPENEINPELPCYTFTIVRPGGNDTCLIDGIVDDPAQRKRINDAIMAVYPNVEQVGFVDVTPGRVQLQMAGGEFCGNATRSAAFLALAGIPGNVSMDVSGVTQTLTAGIPTSGEAYAQMPIFADISKITRVGDTKSGRRNTIVEMEGITQYIDFSTKDLQNLTPDEIKRMAMNTIRANGMDTYPAAGVMYCRQQYETWQITPVVYVKNIDTLFLETACGSGTTALGMTLALETKQSLENMQVMQPSGLPITVRVDYTANSLSYAQISGPIQILESGVLEFDRNGKPFAVERVLDQPALDTVLTDGGLNALYQNIFSQPPYYEKFTDTEVATLLSQYVSRGLLFVAKGADSIIGFGAALPLSEVPDVAAIVNSVGISENGWYMADLGVADAARQRGIGTRMVEVRLAALAGQQIVMRTSENNLISQSLYRKLGFTRIPDIFQEISGIRTDGAVKMDKRIFYTRKA